MANAQPSGTLAGKGSSQSSDAEDGAGSSAEKSSGQGTNPKNSTPEAKKAAAAKAAAAEATAKTAATKAAAAAAAKSATPPPPAPAPAPSPAPAATMPTGLHSNVTTTIFWVGELSGPDNAYISNAMSAWDGNWEANYGGYDDPDNRNGYHPAGFTPNENPFYFALPYNDLDDNGNRKATAASCPNVGSSAVSWCKNSWIKIIKGSKAAYAQWQDVGPLGEDDVNYVFGTAANSNTWGAGAGLDVSPAVRDYLGLQDVDVTSWSFVSASSVPAGPWKDIVTTSPGGW